MQAGDRPDSVIYVRMKQKAALEVGINFKHCKLPAEASAEALIETVKTLNADEDVSGVLVQLPLGENIRPEQERMVTEAISPEKDVDGYVKTSLYCLACNANHDPNPSFHAYNIGHLVSRAADPLFSPCTPAGCIALLESKNIQIAGSNAVVLGRSDIVGNPVAAMLRNRDATVIQCHSKTRNLPELVSVFFSLRWD